MEQYQIVSKVPSTWIDLQNLTADVLTDCGFAVETEKKIETVRGKVEVDVFAEKDSVYSAKVICECKHWEKSVHQNVVHAFRTVMGDYGASYGYIISKKGFQKGAYEAAKNSNISLFSWIEFLEKFKIEWVQHIVNRNYKLGRQVMSKKLEMVMAMHNQKLASEVDANRFAEQAESDFLFLTFIDHYIDLTTHEITQERVDAIMKHFGARLGVNTLSYREFFNHIYEECQKMLEEWNIILSTRKL